MQWLHGTKIYKIETASENFILNRVFILIGIILLFYSILSFNSNLLIGIVFFLPSLVLAIFAIILHYKNISNHLFTLNNQTFALTNSSGLLKWEFPISALIRIDAKPLIRSRGGYIAGFGFTDEKEGIHWVDFVPYNYDKMISDIKQLNPSVKIETDREEIFDSKLW